MDFSAGKNCIWQILSEHNLDIFCPRRNGWNRSPDEAKYPILLLVLVVDRLNLKPLVLRRWSWMGQLGMLLAITKLLSVSTLPVLATVPRATISSRWSLSSNHSKGVALQFVRQNAPLFQLHTVKASVILAIFCGAAFDIINKCFDIVLKSSSSADGNLDISTWFLLMDMASASTVPGATADALETICPRIQ